MLPHEHYHHALEWDDDMCQNSQETSEFERLLKFSTERKLDASEEAYLKEAIKVVFALLEPGHDNLSKKQAFGQVF